MIITLPSGFKIEARKMQGRELSQFANRTESSSSFVQLMRSCWLSTIDPGPYAHAQEGVVDWNRVLSGDILSGVMRLASESIPGGDRYVFPVWCEREPRKFDWAISITKDIQIKRMSDDVRSEMLANGNSFKATLLSGEAVSFKLLTPQEDEPLAKLMRSYRLKNATLAERFAIQVTSVEGLKSQDERTRYRFFLDTDNDVLEDLREKIDAIDCGVETKLEVKCPECGGMHDVQLPFKYLFSPRPKEKIEIEPLS